MKWELTIVAGCLVVVAYGWVLYPILLAGFVRLFGRSARKVSVDEKAPGVKVAILIAAHNEESVIGQRLDNLKLLTKCWSHLEIVVGVDGSGDRTSEEARRAGGDSVRVVEFAVRRGKAAVLRNLVESCPDAEILVFTDANTRFRPDSLVNLIRHLKDPSVGAVCGRLILRPPEKEESTPETTYWDWEGWLKRLESRLDSCLGGNGAIYAVRRELFWHGLPANTIVDDLVIGLKVREQGRRMVFDPEAIAEETAPLLRFEWARRVRIGAGDYQALRLCWRLLLPKYGWVSWIFWSHKLVRWLTPHLLLMALLAAAPLLLDMDLFPFATGVTIVLGTALALLGTATGRALRMAGRKGPKILLMVEHFVMMQAALFVGFLKFCRGDLKGQWERTER